MNIPTNLKQEQVGAVKVQAAFARMDAIWWATTTADLGIDGHMKFLRGRHSIGSTATLI